jgi:hypothetical protein
MFFNPAYAASPFYLRGVIEKCPIALLSVIFLDSNC